MKLIPIAAAAMLGLTALAGAAPAAAEGQPGYHRVDRDGGYRHDAYRHDGHGYRHDWRHHDRRWQHREWRRHHGDYARHR